jgi:hypothetical protein
MRLAIADPPYLGLADMFYGTGERLKVGKTSTVSAARRADSHPDAARYDDPEAHRQMVNRLVDEYDGWAIAMLPSSLRHYLAWVPESTRVAVWHDPNVMPTGSHPRRKWEPVLIYRPAGRRRIQDVPGPHVSDVLTCVHTNGSASNGFAGAKPQAWTSWVLAMLGWDPDTDTVTDLFPGSGAVENQVNQTPLPIQW